MMGPSPPLIPLLETKLFLPPPWSSAVQRVHLISRLEAGLIRVLTLVSAPAVSGEACHRRGSAVAPDHVLAMSIVALLKHIAKREHTDRANKGNE
jgi:hypothetical protein